MNRKEFIEGLKKALEMKMNKSEIDSQVEFYSSYIKDEVKKGRKETDVIEELGDPWAIAKNLRGPVDETWDEVESNQTGGYNTNQGHDTNQGAKVYVTNNKWVGFAIIIIILAILFTILSVFFGIMRLLSPILLPILIVYMVLRILRK